MAYGLWEKLCGRMIIDEKPEADDPLSYLPMFYGLRMLAHEAKDPKVADAALLLLRKIEVDQAKARDLLKGYDEPSKGAGIRVVK